jgi:lipoate-protein ligase A
MKTHLLNFENLSIRDQLELEKKLLKEREENFIIINSGSEKTIVMGVSQKAEDVVDINLAISKDVPIIRRFSGGGTVLVDHDTLFVTFIMNQNVLNEPLYPKNILMWSKSFFEKALLVKDFDVKGNDFTLGDFKIGGNAQYIKKNRFLQHTSFLWDFDIENMNLLLHPPNEPDYRQKRSHKDFLSKLSNYMTKREFIEKISHQTFIQFSCSKERFSL